MIEFQWQTHSLPEIDYLDQFVKQNSNLSKQQTEYLGISELYKYSKSKKHRLAQVVSSLEQRLQVFGNIAPSRQLAKNNLNPFFDNHYDSNDPFIDDTEAELINEFILEEKDISSYQRIKGGLDVLMNDKSFQKKWNKKQRPKKVTQKLLTKNQSQFKEFMEFQSQLPDIIEISSTNSNQITNEIEIQIPTSQKRIQQFKEDQYNNIKINKKQKK